MLFGLPKKRTSKMGRTKIPLLGKLETENVIFAHKNMTEILKLAKKNKHNYKGSIVDFIDMSARLGSAPWILVQNGC